MTGALAHFAIERDGENYRLQLALEDGAVLNIIATFEQLDLLGEEIDRRLDADQDLPTPKF
ncbi:hypothetical protein [Sphingobium baderi]|uniref:Uncharacterized protein n=1 Tax=Sphingobium baderi TaxID=1332080 RepID=A0A0S3EZ30_9SPHN|nr:hypothetical protein [Sphingobium baderi]ALR20672.1 hypothetical protein ATN00_10550 [Sphingobium baderi]